MEEEEKVIKWSKKKPKFRSVKDHDTMISSAQHIDSIKARKKMVKRFFGAYSAKQIDTLAMLAFERIIETNNIKAGDSIENELGI